MKILRPKGRPQTKTISFRVAPELAARLEKLRADADACGLILDVSEALSSALAHHLTAAERELAAASESAQ